MEFNSDKIKVHCEKCGLEHNYIVNGKVFRYCKKCDDQINNYLDDLYSKIKGLDNNE